MQKIRIKLMNLVYEYESITRRSWYAMFGFCIALSWIYAISSQCCITFPYNPVPVSLQGITFLFCSWLFGRIAVFAYLLYLLQGACGAPFFSHFGCGIAHLLGPTGGYLIGFFFSMLFMAVTRNILPGSKVCLLCKYWVGMLIVFAFGLARLLSFVSANKVLTIGFYPFFVCDFVLKAFLMLLLSFRFKR